MIRLIRVEDEKQLWPLINAYLTDTYAGGGDIPPTEENIALAVLYAIQGALTGDPCLVAEEDGEIIGYTICRGITTPWAKTRYKDIRSWGTYVKPEHRGKSVATTLLITAGRVAKIAGYDRFIGVTYGAGYGENAEHIATNIRSAKEAGKIMVMMLTRAAKSDTSAPEEKVTH